MKNYSKHLKAIFAVLVIFFVCSHRSFAGNPPQKSNTTTVKKVNPNFDPNKKLVNKRTEQLINRDRKDGESFLNKRTEPLLNRKYVPKKYTKAEYYK